MGQSATIQKGKIISNGIGFFQEPSREIHVRSPGPVPCNGTIHGSIIDAVKTGGRDTTIVGSTTTNIQLVIPSENSFGKFLVNHVPKKTGRESLLINHQNVPDERRNGHKIPGLIRSIFRDFYSGRRRVNRVK